MRIRYLQNTDEILENSALHVKTPQEYKGQWLAKYPHCRRVELEIGSGKGKFVGEMAAKYPETLYIGVEKFSTILARAVLTNEQNPDNLAPNLALVRSDALEMSEIIADGELDRIYLNFSDPWPKKRHTKNRLTSNRFLPLYAKWLKAGGELHFKTDNDALFEYSIESLQENGWTILFQTRNWHKCPEREGDVMTEYEIQFSARGKKINKLTAVPPSAGPAGETATSSEVPASGDETVTSNEAPAPVDETATSNEAPTTVGATPASGLEHE